MDHLAHPLFRRNDNGNVKMTRDSGKTKIYKETYHIMKRIAMALILLNLFDGITFGQSEYPTLAEGDYVVSNFRFGSGETMPNLNLHYTTIGKPTRGTDGKVNNAVLIMHGTTGNGKGFLSPLFAGNLFGPGQLLDAEKYFIILPDAIGHGKSGKPSDGLRMKFPKYNYDDMVLADYRLLTEHLKVDHLRLVTGTSMGGMHTWVWGYTYPDFMDALCPLASLPVEIAGRNRVQRKMMINLIEMIRRGMAESRTSSQRSDVRCHPWTMFMVSSPLQWQKMSHRETAETLWRPVRQVPVVA